MGFLPGPKPSLVGIGWLGWHAADARELPGSLPSLAGAGPCRPGIRRGGLPCPNRRGGLALITSA
jgi:hypothetical protein